MSLEFLISIVVLTVLVDILIIVNILKWKKSKKLSANDQEYVKLNWRKVMEYLDSDSNKSVIEADKILSYVLQKKGYTGSVGDQLKASESFFTNLDSVWRAHKLRNRLAHEIGNVEYFEAKKAIDGFKRGIIDLGVNI